MPKNWEQAREWVAAGGGGAPLEIACPRCGRRGVVSPDGDGEYGVAWHDDANGWLWHDTGVTPEELVSPEFGCGHDRLSNGGFIGGAPLASGAAPPVRRGRSARTSSVRSAVKKP